MSEGSGGEKTEQPSPKKLRDAREKGQVAKSQEVVISATLFSVIGYLWVMWDRLTQSMLSFFTMASQSLDGDFNAQALNLIVEIGKSAALDMAPLLLVGSVIAIASNFLQVGSIFSFDSIAPKFEKISPASGMKKIFSKKQLVEILKSLVKIAFLSFLLFLVLRDSIGPYIYSLDCGLPCVTAVTGYFLQKILIYSFIAFLIVAVADFWFQKRNYIHNLMMTKEEVKREYKESEGDPHIKGKRKELAQELIFGDDGEIARKSTAVVVNPTHFAVAILFKEGVTPLPTVVAKGRDKHAHLIRTQAEEAGVPVFRNVALARALYGQTNVLEFIPDEFFGVIAEVLAWVVRNRDALYNGPTGSGVIDMDSGDHRKPFHAKASNRNDAFSNSEYSKN